MVRGLQDILAHWPLHFGFWAGTFVVSFVVMRWVVRRPIANWLVAVFGLFLAAALGLAVLSSAASLLDWLSPSDFDAQATADSLSAAAPISTVFVVVAAAGDALRHLDAVIASGAISVGTSLLAGGIAFSQIRRSQS